MEKCANCERTIGKLEVAHVFRGEVVCSDCAATLSRQNAVAEFGAKSTSEANPLARIAAAQTSPVSRPAGRRCGCGAAIAANADRCPECGKRFTTPVTWLVLGVILFIAFAVLFGALARRGI
jgi:hypothetical protein